MKKTIQDIKKIVKQTYTGKDVELINIMIDLAYELGKQHYDKHNK